MPLTFERLHPGGMIDNSPAFQRRDRGGKTISPEGKAEPDRVSRPYGTHPTRTLNPALKRRAILICPSGTETASSASKVSGIGLESCATWLCAARVSPRLTVQLCVILVLASPDEDFGLRVGCHRNFGPVEGSA